MLITTQRYLEKLKTPVFSGNKPVSGETVQIITIPCYNEPDIGRTIRSLIDCEKPQSPVEIVVLVNAYTQTSQEILEVNRKSYRELLALAGQYNTEKFKIIPLYTESLVYKYPGAGIPRKMVMDEAVRRFASVDNDQGVIVSLDADCLVANNYLKAIEKTFSDDRVCVATIEFHHPVEHLDAEDPIRKAMELYELYLRYYRTCLEYCGFPYPYYTIGSAMAFRMSAYTKAGGMGRQAAGEDFYFLQKVFPLGKVVHIDETKVYPAARFSDRVPFGTGTALKKMVEEGGTPQKMTYSFESFKALKHLFDKLEEWHASDDAKMEQELTLLPDYLQDFLREDSFLQHWQEIKSNASGFSSFRKRFFHYFNAFKIVKYLNYVHPERIPLKEVRGEYDLLHRNLCQSLY